MTATLTTNQTKAAQLRRTADYIEANKDDYYWPSPVKCTCGMLLLANEATLEATVYKEVFESFHDFYTSCESCDRPIGEVFAWLKQQGYTLQDIVRLEYGNAEAMQAFESTFRPCFEFEFSNPDVVITRLREWADELEAVQVEAQV